MPKDGEFEHHPAFGLVSFSRVQGDPGKLFGSNLTSHGTYIALRVHQAKRCHDLGRDFVMADRSELGVIEVALSVSQFAELLTTMNVGEGVPCTITQRDGRRVPGLPEAEASEPERIYQAFVNKIKKFMIKLRAGVKEGREALLRKAPLRRKERDHIAEVLKRVCREVEDSMPFYLQQFQESTERTTEQAKADVDSFVMTVAIHTGMESLREVMADDGPKALPHPRQPCGDEGCCEELELWVCGTCGHRFDVGEISATVCPQCNASDIRYLSDAVEVARCEVVRKAGM